MWAIHFHKESLLCTEDCQPSSSQNDTPKIQARIETRKLVPTELLWVEAHDTRMSRAMIHYVLFALR